ncbi:hypothetical protein EOD39_11294 [Acipenser ruthenus]|uniref:Uncharacterized protein n=1 Tax=Acipenser ruthenus TaxID=7906 RepID=A0A444UPC2_ACIRT|nr:hypothetical protein EOD39_11294 [Acipenser ruthenus]
MVLRTSDTGSWQVSQMDQKVEDILNILTEQFRPHQEQQQKPVLLSTKAAAMKCQGCSFDKGEGCRCEELSSSFSSKLQS